jgi:hypothetical protein
MSTFRGVGEYSVTHDIQGDDADDFNPDRFLDEKHELSAPIGDTKDGKAFYLSFKFVSHPLFPRL